MPLRLNASDPGFEADFARLLEAKRETAADVNETVARILSDVRDRGDDAVIEYTERFDKIALTPETMRITEAEVEAAIAQCDTLTLDALKLAAGRIRAFHEKQRPAALSYKDEAGVRLGQRWTAIAAAGLYVPGGTAAYPSSVLMNAIPASVAGVERRVMVVPTPDGVVNPLVLAAARTAGITEIYRIGGAQAVAALAYGTATIAPVDKVVGPGNVYVAAIQPGSFSASATTRISDGPAIMSMPTVPKTWRLAAAT